MWQKFLLSKNSAETIGVEKLIYDDPMDYVLNGKPILSKMSKQ